MTLYGAAADGAPAGYARVPQHAPRADVDAQWDVERGLHASDGIFRLPAAHRQRLASDAWRRCRVDGDADGRVAPLDGALDGRALFDAFGGGGAAARAPPQQSWHRQRYWRCICGTASVACATVAALIVYWGVVVGSSLQATLVKVDTLHPTLLRDTISDAADVLRGAAATSRAIGALSEGARPALLNLTAASASMLANVARITGQPKIEIALGGTRG